MSEQLTDAVFLRLAKDPIVASHVRLIRAWAPTGCFTDDNEEFQVYAIKTRLSGKVTDNQTLENLALSELLNIIHRALMEKCGVDPDSKNSNVRDVNVCLTFALYQIVTDPVGPFPMRYRYAIVY